MVGRPDDNSAMEGSRPDPDLLQRWIHEQGVPAGEVGARLGLSRAAGYRWLQRYGIAATTPPLPQHQLVARWRAGTPADRLAAEHGLPVEAVRDRLVAAAAMTAGRTYYLLGSTADPLPQDVLRGWYLHDHFPVSQIATLAGITARQVRYRLSRYHLSGGHPDPSPRLPQRLDRTMLREMSERTARAIATARERVTAARLTVARSRALRQVAVEPDRGEQPVGSALVDCQRGLG